jgi:hypothetical protein
VTPTAIELFAEMIKAVIRPGLQELGFKGSGTTFVWPAERKFALVGIQKSRFSNRTSVQFTLNVTVADADAWNRRRAKDRGLPKRPAPNTFHAGMWQRRVGKLMPAPTDHWWRLDRESDIDDVGQNVVDVVAKYVVPAIIERT